MYEENVFINCPFDKAYSELLRPLIFTIVILGFSPRIATETSDSGVLRLDKIKRLISESQYSIHDLSRVKSDKRKEYYRLNMPFELGLDFGCKGYSIEEKHGKKACLILGNIEYDYMKALSDINGIDIKYHHQDQKKIIKSVRNWFIENTSLDAGATMSHPRIFSRFIEFNTIFYEKALAEIGRASCRETV